MYRVSRLREIMNGLPRTVFDRLVETHQADKHSKGFGCWEQLLAMVYAQLSGASSLRVLEAGFNSQSNHHYHLGAKEVRRSTLADANSKRDTKLFADIVRVLMSQAKRTLREECAELLYALDSTSITLKGRGFDSWTLENRTCHTQGVKLHLLCAVDGKQPVHHSITAANINDIDEGVLLPLESKAIYVFDKGYCDYNWWHRIENSQALFVTRFKSNAALAVDKEQPIPADACDLILKDEIVRFANKHPRGGRKNHYEKPLRRVTVARPDHMTPLILATNDLESPAITIAERYRKRWQVELFFKWIKQHLEIKRFFGRSENAVRIQILTALIAYLLLSAYHKAQKFTGSLWILLAEIRSTLFQRPGIEVALERQRRERQANFYAKQGALFR